MKATRIISFIMVAVIFLVTVTPVIAAGDSVKVVVENKSGSAGQLTLSGPQRYTFDLKAGKNRLEVEKGVYSYSFFGCGRYTYGTFNANKTNAKLTVDCVSTVDTGLVSLKVNNRSGKEFTMILSGTAYYYFTVKIGANVFQVKPGQYTYTHYACTDEETGKVSVNAKGANLNIKKCPASKGSTSSSVGMRIKFVNLTGAEMTLYLYGATSYTFKIPPGRSTVRVMPGTYSYTMIRSCGVHSGTIKINKPIIWTWWCN
jgi:hypothetical protein